MGNSSFLDHNPPVRRRFGLPLFCGLIGILMALLIGNIPHSYFSFALSCTLITFIMAHVFWFHKAIQSLQNNLNHSTDSLRSLHFSHPPTELVEEEQAHEMLIEATFFQNLRDQLTINHPPHLQAQCLQDQKMHLIQTTSLIPLLRENQLEILAQPIVSLPQKRLAFFSCTPYLALDNGMLINMNTLTDSVPHLSSQQAIDKIVLFQSFQFVHRHYNMHPNYGFICSLPPTIYKDHPFFEELTDFLVKSHFPFQGLILEIPLDTTEAIFNHLTNLSRYGVRFIGKWPDRALPNNLAELMTSSFDFIMLSYDELLAWTKNQPRRQSIESLQQILETSSQTIICHVDQEQHLYHNLPILFDYAVGNAFGVPKPFYHIQM